MMDEREEYDEEELDEDELGEDEDEEEQDEFELAAEEGEMVFAHSWDSGSPGLGAGCECVYRYEGRFYYLSNDYESAGPYETLDEAIEENPQLIQVQGCTLSIESPLLDDEAILARIEFSDAEMEEEAKHEAVARGLSLPRDEWEASEDEASYLIDGKEIRINRTRYEFRAPAALIPLGPAEVDGEEDSDDR